MEQEKLHLVIISSPGMGHLVPVLLLGNLIATHHHSRITILAVTTESSPVESQLISSFTENNINIIKIPLPDMSDLLRPEDTVFTHLVVMMSEARQGISSAISSMKRRPDVIIADMFSTESLPIADETDPLNIPGCVPIRCENVPDPMLDRNNREYDEYVRMGNDFATLPDGILINTWRDMEPRFLDALKYNETFKSLLKVPIYDIGPLTRDVNPVVSKGSGGPDHESGPSSFLPKGFLARYEKLGLVVPLWAPQVEILNHVSIGGFLSHCGVSSVCESIAAGVPMIAWPLHAEQRLNASTLVEEGKEGKLMRDKVKALRESAKESNVVK
ncbi:anthocyanidin 3-O-glucosyltransferase 5-like protein [Tanacetum coccineum]